MSKAQGTPGPVLDSIVLPYRDLVSDQQEAFEKLAERIGTLAKENAPKNSASKEDAEFLVRLDDRRPNQAFMIDGSRGSGKTAVMLAFLSFLSKRWRKEDYAADFEAPKADFSKHAHMKEVLGDVPIVPLRILDMRPFPEGRSLILELPGALLPIVEWLERCAVLPRCPGAIAPKSWEHQEHRARTAWKKFARIAALGHARSINQKSLSAEQFVDEFEEAGAKRPSIEACFTELVDEVLCGLQMQKNLHIQPLLIIPIDDADMQPKRCMELLDLLHFLRHPRLVYLLTGDTDLFRAVLRRQAESWLVGDGPECLRDMAKGQLRDLPVQILDKHIPRPNRLELRELAPLQRVLILLGEPGENESAPDYRSLRESLESHGGLLARALPSRMRGLIQLRARVREASRTIGPRVLHGLEDAYYLFSNHEALMFVDSIWANAIDTIDETETKESFRTVFEDDEEGMQIVSGRVRLTPSFRHASPVVESGHVFLNRSVYLKATLAVSEAEIRTPTWGDTYSDLAAGISSASKTGRSSGSFGESAMSEQIAYAYALKVYWAKKLNQPEIVLGDLRNASFIFAVHKHEGAPFRSAWPLPEWDELKHALSFIAGWAQVPVIAGRLGVDMVAKHFVLLAFSALSEDHSPLTSPTESSWEEIVKKAPPSPTRENAYARRLILLTTPECGLSNDSADELFEALKNKKLISTPLDRMELRRSWIRTGMAVTGTSTEKRIDSFCDQMSILQPDSRWSIPDAQELYQVLGSYRYESGTLADLAKSSRTRMRMLESLSNTERRQISRAFSQSDHRRAEGSNAVLMMENLWRQFGGKIRASPLHSGPYLHIGRQKASEPKDRGVPALSKVSFETKTPSSERSPILSWMYGIFWDACNPQDRSGAFSPNASTQFQRTSDVSLIAWPCGQLRDGKDYAWPFPDYDNMFFWEQAVEAWNSIVEAPPESVGSFAFHEQLAVAWVQTLSRLPNTSLFVQFDVIAEDSASCGRQLGATISELWNKPNGGGETRNEAMRVLFLATCSRFFADTERSGVSSEFRDAMLTQLYPGIVEWAKSISTADWGPAKE